VKPQPPGVALTYLGSQRRVTECLAPKYEPTGERMTNRVAWLEGPRPRVGSVPIIVGLMYKDEFGDWGTQSLSSKINLLIHSSSWSGSKLGRHDL